METVILVEPYTNIREALIRLLAEVGYRVMAFSDPDRALRTAQMEPISAVILDVGVHAHHASTAEKCADEILRARPGARIIFTTCVQWTPARASARVLQKPFEISSLLAELRADGPPDSKDSTL